MRPILRVAPALALATAVCLTAPAASPATVSPSSAVSAADFDVRGYALAMNPSGERSALALTGERGSRTQLFARLGLGRSFGPSQRLENLASRFGRGGYVQITDPKVSVSPDGSAVAAWTITKVASRDGQPSRRLRVALAPDGKPFGPARTLRSSARLELTGAVAGRDGLVVLSWRSGQRLWTAVRRGSGRFGAPRSLGASSAFRVPPTLVLAPGGSVVAGWSPLEGSAARAAVLRSGARRFGRTLIVSTEGESTNFARAVSGPGGAGIAWTIVGERGDPQDGTLRFARLTSRAGAFAAPVTLADVDADGGPHVSLPKQGIVTAWRTYDLVVEAGDNDSFADSQVSAAASWLQGATPRALSAPPSASQRPVAAALADRGLIAWLETPDTDAGIPVRLAVAGPQGWLATETVRAAGEQPPAARFQGVYDDERPGALDLTLAPGRASALLAWVTPTNFVSAPRRLHVATYRP